jgi:ABC-2 type transport system ATP-binding protein
MLAIQTNKLSKNYGSHLGMKDVSLEVKEGEVFGFIGPNGAGKSTFIRALLGLLVPTSGSGTMLGLDISTQGFDGSHQKLWGVNYLSRQKV